MNQVYFMCSDKIQSSVFWYYEFRVDPIAFERLLCESFFFVKIKSSAYLLLKCQSLMKKAY